MPDLSERREKAQAQRGQLAESRGQFASLRAAHDRLLREAELRRERLQVAGDEAGTWTRRQEGARHQIDALTARESASVAESDRLQRRPGEIEGQRMTLLGVMPRPSRTAGPPPTGWPRRRVRKAPLRRR
jgi:hypothetical protein